MNKYFVKYQTWGVNIIHWFPDAIKRDAYAAALVMKATVVVCGRLP